MATIGLNPYADHTKDAIKAAFKARLKIVFPKGDKPLTDQDNDNARKLIAAKDWLFHEKRKYYLTEPAPQNPDSMILNPKIQEILNKMPKDEFYEEDKRLLRMFGTPALLAEYIASTTMENTNGRWFMDHKIESEFGRLKYILRSSGIFEGYNETIEGSINLISDDAVRLAAIKKHNENSCILKNLISAFYNNRTDLMTKFFSEQRYNAKDSSLFPFINNAPYGVYADDVIKSIMAAPIINENLRWFARIIKFEWAKYLVNNDLASNSIIERPDNNRDLWNDKCGITFSNGIVFRGKHAVRYYHTFSKRIEMDYPPTEPEDPCNNCRNRCGSLAEKWQCGVFQKHAETYKFWKVMTGKSNQF